MMKYTDDRGRALGIVPDLLVVPPDLQWTAKELLSSTYYPDLIATGEGEQKLAQNVLRGTLDLLVSPYLMDTNDWFVLSTRSLVKPVIFQSRVPVEFSALEGESESGFMRDQYIYGVRARYNVGYGPWQTAYANQVP
jgi:phage major head subunit gpT-like protein